MSKTILGVVALVGILGLGLAGIAMGNSAVVGDEPAMMVSPQTIVLAKVTFVTIHTNITASTVDASTLALNEVSPTDVWADDTGDIVARFDVADLSLEPGEVTLTLSGLFKDGSSFSATDLVRVK